VSSPDTTSSKMDDSKKKMNDLKDTVTTAVQQRTQKLNESMANVQNQLMMYGSQIQDLLGKYQADIQDYKFSVEKRGEGLSIDVAFKAAIKSRDVTGTSSDISP
jgi:uncharacterized coiled-coil DUF342 family protein